MPEPGPQRATPAEHSWGLVVLDARGRVAQHGGWATGASWSTIKVPLALAALARPDAGTGHLVRAALRASDNDAARGLWEQLGGGALAAEEVDRVLAAYGCEGVRTEWRTVHPPYSPYGQTRWSLVEQVRFAAALHRRRGDPAVAQVLGHLGSIDPHQRWGLGTLPGATFKGGWGPGRSGDYLVRQLGLVEVDDGWAAVALAVADASGSMAAAVERADDLVRRLVGAGPS